MIPLLFLLFLGWGSFLNMLGYRLIHGGFDKPRSFCPDCKETISWYDNIPLISWILLRGKCRHCKKPISLLYPFIELFTAICMTALLLTVHLEFYPAYFIFFSALIVTIRTDLETMLISRWVTLFLVPIGMLCAWSEKLPITFTESVWGALFGYLFLWAIAKIYKLLKKIDGMGQGDMDLLCLIGAFIGIFGCLISLLIGSILGSLIGIYTMFTDKQWRNKKIPFGPFLAFGAMIFVLAQEQIINYFLI